MWHERVTDGFYWQAKVFNEGSPFGIDGGRVSKLAICDGGNWDAARQVYNYDRGLDFDKCPPDTLAKIVAICEATPFFSGC